MDSIGQSTDELLGPPEFNEELVAILPKLKAEALYLTRSPHKADDLLQATCLRVLSRSHQFHPGTRLDRWASRIMNNIWFDELRERVRRREQALPELELAEEANFESRVEAQLFVSDLRRACTRLSDDDFSLLVKIYVYGWTYREVAAELGVPIGTVLSRVSRAKSTIRQVKGRDRDT